MKLNNIRSFLIDGDGVLWRADEPVPGLNRFIDVLNQRGINWALLTNNATSTLEMYTDKLARFGVQANRNQIVSSATATITHLKDRYPAGAALYVVGMPPLVDLLNLAGFKASSDPDFTGNAAAVIAALDRNFTYDKLKTATRLIRGGAAFIATNPDRSFPSPTGLEPGAGSIVAAISAASDAEPEVMGKPESPIFQQAMKQIKANPATTTMIGDRLETDILGAQRIGLGTILVLSGVTTPQQVATNAYQPDHIFDSIAELAEAIAAL